MSFREKDNPLNGVRVEQIEPFAQKIVHLILEGNLDTFQEKKKDIKQVYPKWDGLVKDL